MSKRSGDKARANINTKNRSKMREKVRALRQRWSAAPASTSGAAVSKTD